MEMHILFILITLNIAIRISRILAIILISLQLSLAVWRR